MASSLRTNALISLSLLRIVLARVVGEVQQTRTSPWRTPGASPNNGSCHHIVPQLSSAMIEILRGSCGGDEVAAAEIVRSVLSVDEAAKSVHDVM